MTSPEFEDRWGEGEDNWLQPIEGFEVPDTADELLHKIDESTVDGGLIYEQSYLDLMFTEYLEGMTSVQTALQELDDNFLQSNENSVAHFSYYVDGQDKSVLVRRLHDPDVGDMWHVIANDFIKEDDIVILEYSEYAVAMDRVIFDYTDGCVTKDVESGWNKRTLSSCAIIRKYLDACMIYRGSESSMVKPVLQLVTPDIDRVKEDIRELTYLNEVLGNLQSGVYDEGVRRVIEGLGQ